MDMSEIERALKKQKATLMKFLRSDTIGIINTIKPGQEHLKVGYTLEEKYPDKKFYHFVDDVVSFNQLENFPFIEVWVNTACPRIGLDDQDKFKKGVININDALNAEKILTQ